MSLPSINRACIDSSMVGYQQGYVHGFMRFYNTNGCKLILFLPRDGSSQKGLKVQLLVTQLQGYLAMIGELHGNNTGTKMMNKILELREFGNLNYPPELGNLNYLTDFLKQ